MGPGPVRQRANVAGKDREEVTNSPVKHRGYLIQHALCKIGRLQCGHDRSTGTIFFEGHSWPCWSPGVHASRLAQCGTVGDLAAAITRELNSCDFHFASPRLSSSSSSSSLYLCFFVHHCFALLDCVWPLRGMRILSDT